MLLCAYVVKKKFAESPLCYAIKFLNPISQNKKISEIRQTAQK